MWYRSVCRCPQCVSNVMTLPSPLPPTEREGEEERVASKIFREKHFGTTFPFSFCMSVTTLFVVLLFEQCRHLILVISALAPFCCASLPPFLSWERRRQQTPSRGVPWEQWNVFPLSLSPLFPPTTLNKHSSGLPKLREEGGIKVTAAHTEREL